VVGKVINNLGIGAHVSESNFTLIGMAGLIAGVIHAPLTAIFLIAEVTGGHTLIVPLMITAAISYLITRNALDYTIYTKELAKIGALLTHNKDERVLGMMEVQEVIEDDFVPVHPRMTLGQMLHGPVSRSTRNIFPVLDDSEKLLGIILLDDIRPIMFDNALYDTVKVESLMHAPPEMIFFGEDTMKTVMKKFQHSGAWNLPVVREGKYAGFISKSKLLTAYRKKLINFTQ